MPFIADGVCYLVDHTCNHTLTNLLYRCTTVECEFTHPEHETSDAISLTVGYFEAETNEAETTERGVRLRYDPSMGAFGRLISMSAYSTVIDVNRNEIGLQDESFGLRSKDAMVTSTPLAIRKQSNELTEPRPSLHDDSMEMSTNTISADEYGSSFNEEDLSSNDRKGIIESTLTANEKVHRHDMFVSTMTPSRVSKPIGANEIEAPNTAHPRPLFKARRNVKNISNIFNSTGDSILSFKTRRPDGEKNKKNVKAIMDRFSWKTAREESKSESLQREKRDSELRLIRKMRESSLKSIELEEKQKLKRDGSESEIVRELETVRRLRKDFSGPEDENKNEIGKGGCSSGFWGDCSGGMVAEKIETYFASEVFLSTNIDGDLQPQNLSGRNLTSIRNAMEEELEMVRRIRKSMTFEEDEENCFHDDVKEKIASAELQLEMAGQAGNLLEEFEERKTRSISHYEERVDSELRVKRPASTSDDHLAERRARRASEKERADKLQRELEDVRIARQSATFNPEAKDYQSLNERDLGAVRKLRRTKSLGSLPQFTGDNLRERNISWVFGGVNILPYREVAIKLEELSGSKQSGTQDDNRCKP